MKLQRCKKSLAALKINSLPVEVVVTYPILVVHDRILLAVLFTPHQVFISGADYCYTLILLILGRWGNSSWEEPNGAKIPQSSPGIVSANEAATEECRQCNFSINHCQLWARGAGGSCGNSCTPRPLSLWPPRVFLLPIHGTLRARKLGGRDENLNILNATGSLGSASHNNI